MKYHLFACVLGLVAALGRCNRNEASGGRESEVVDVSDSEGNFQLLNYWGNKRISPYETILTAEGHRLSVQEIGLYISAMAYENEDGGRQPFTPAGNDVDWHIPNFETSYWHYSFPPRAPAGSGDRLLLVLGPDRLTQATPPDQLPDEHPLASSNLYVNNTVGYTYLRFVATLDTAPNANSQALVDLKVELTGVSGLDTIRLQPIMRCSPPFFLIRILRVGVFWDRLFQGIPLPQGLETPAGQDSLRANLQTLFSPV